MRHLLVIATTILLTLVGTPAIATAAPASYVALGDSYSSGLGTGSYSLSSACKRGTRAYPYLYSGSATGFVACSGSDIEDVTGQLSEVTPSAQLVTLTVGGNDIGFSDVVSRCTAFSSDANCKSAVDAAVLLIEPMRDDLVVLLGEIRKRAGPAARIMLLGYPHLYSTGSSCGFGQPSRAKRTAMFTGGQLLNEALDGAVDEVADARVQFVDVRDAFRDHSICASSSQRWINGLVLFNSAESYHPNRAGHLNGYLPALRSALQAAGV